MYFQDAEAAIIVYDLTFSGSFESARNWVKELKENATIPDILIAVVGNKSDL
jgi:GTPase SAR1 family protein